MHKKDKSTDIVVTPENKKSVVMASILDWLITIAVGVLVGILLVVFVVQKDNVYGDSMLPTLQSGYVVFTQKISTYFNHYNRGDIVILDGSGMEGYNHEEYLIKRIVGLPGDTIRIMEGHVFIREQGESTFVMLDEPYLEEGTLTEMMCWGLEKGYDEVVLAEGQYYCLGDNRPVSNDSRNLGPFSEDRIMGVAFFVLYPFNAIRPI